MTTPTVEKQPETTEAGKVKVIYPHNGVDHEIEMPLAGFQFRLALPKIKVALSQRRLYIRPPYHLNGKEIKETDETVLKAKDKVRVDP